MQANQNINQTTYSNIGKWCFNQGYNLVVGATVYTGIYALVSSGENLRNLSNFFFNQAALKVDPKGLKNAFDRAIVDYKSHGSSVPENVDSNKILTSFCPKKEYFRQASLLYDINISNSPPATGIVTINSVISPVLTELMFRGLIQDLILKRLVGKIIRYVSPSNASIVDSLIYTSFRILLTNILYSSPMFTSQNLLSEEERTLGTYKNFIIGTIAGILKETHGIAASIGVPAIHNFAVTIPIAFAKC